MPLSIIRYKRKGKNIKAWFKSKTADKILSPVREEILSLLDDGCSLIDIGCGTGDLLFKAKDKIRFGLGVDTDPRMIAFATEKNRSTGSENLKFIKDDINSFIKLSNYEIDIASSTLCLHEMKENDAIHTLQTMANITSRLLIADYSKPESYWSKLSIELDEMISGHYDRFRKYRDNGYLPYLAGRAGLVISQIIETPIDGILIWELRSKV